MSLLIVLLGLMLLLLLIIKKVSPMLALLIVSIVTGLLLGMSPVKVMSTISQGIGNTLGGMVMVLALGAMLGKLIEESGSSKKNCIYSDSSFRNQEYTVGYFIYGFAGWYSFVL